MVDIYDETGETVGIATILTMVKKINKAHEKFNSYQSILGISFYGLLGNSQQVVTRASTKIELKKEELRNPKTILLK